MIQFVNGHILKNIVVRNKIGKTCYFPGIGKGCRRCDIFHMDDRVHHSLEPEIWNLCIRIEDQKMVRNMRTRFVDTFEKTHIGLMIDKDGSRMLF